MVWGEVFGRRAMLTLSEYIEFAATDCEGSPWSFAAIAPQEHHGHVNEPKSSMTGPRVLAVHCSGTHSFSKTSQASIRLIAGLGVEGDVHSGTTAVQR